MQVNTLDGQQYNWKIPEKLAKGNKRPTSKAHAKAKEILHSLYSTCGIYEEIPIVIEGKKKLFLDFYIPTLGIAVEVHGRQHYEFTPLYHNTKMDFFKGQANDRNKAEWCELNGITLIVLPYNEKEEEWKNKLKAKP